MSKKINIFTAETPEEERLAQYRFLKDLRETDVLGWLASQGRCAIIEEDGQNIKIHPDGRREVLR